MIIIVIGFWLWQVRPDRPQVPVIIYLVDTLRADRLSIYGYARRTTPNLEALAAGSVVFNRAYAPAPWTLPSVASLITSTFVCEHGLVTERKKLNPGIKTLAQRLSEAGYFTGGLYNNLYVGSLSGLDRGYASFETATNERGDEVRAFLDALPDQPFLFYLHSVEPHDPHRVPFDYIREYGNVDVDTREAYHDALLHYNRLRTADWVAREPAGTTDNTREQAAAFEAVAAFREPVQVLYDAAVAYADDNLGEVIGILKEKGIWDKAVFIYLSDHGDEFGERGAWGHDQSVYDELMRVPLIVHFPQGEFAGRRIPDSVSLVDVMPSLFDYLRAPELCDGCRGESFMPLIRNPDRSVGTAPEVHAVRINEKRYNRDWDRLHGNINVLIQSGTWKGIWNAEVDSLELYDLSADPAERSDRSAARPDVARQLGQQARAWLQDCNSRRKDPQEIYGPDEQTIEQLRALGYFN